MQPAKTQPIEHFTILCVRCDRPVLARANWVGREVQCPHCSSVIRIPERPKIDVPVRSDPPNLAPKKCFNFACPRCECLLEAHTGMCGQDATCPTCAARIMIPYLKRGSGLPERAKLIDSPVEQPTPLHAYAASGDQAPKLIRGRDDSLVIECPRCNAHSPIDADACIACAAPFTMEGATTTTKIRTRSYGNASLTLGVVSLFTFPVLILGVLAIGFGALSAIRARTVGRLVGALFGVLFGMLSVAGGILFWLFR